MAAKPENGGGHVEVDPEALIDKGNRLAELPGASGGLFAILKKLSDDLDSLGEPWGDDKIGKQFSEGSQGYLAAVESLVGNASTGPDASGALPVYAQLLVNYGAAIAEAGKVFAAGEDQFAQWILKNYVDSDASGNPGPYTGPRSSDPGGASGPPGPDQDRGNRGGGPGSGGPGVGSPDGSGLGGGNRPPGPGDLPGGASGPPAPRSFGADGFDPASVDPALDAATLDAVPNSGVPLESAPLIPGEAAYDARLDPSGAGLPGAVGPVGYPAATGLGAGETPVRPGTGAGGPGTGAGGTGPGTPMGPFRGPTSLAATDGERSRPTGTPMAPRSAMSPNTMMPGVPGVPGGAAGGAGADGKDKRRERRREPARPENREGEPVEGDPWQRSGWPTGGR